MTEGNWEMMVRDVLPLLYSYYDTVISIKSTYIAKNFTRAEETYITSILNQGVFYPLTKPSPTPLNHGGSKGV